MGPQGPAGAGNPGPQGPAGPPGNGAYGEDIAAFAGFTSALSNGNAGGRDGMHAKCAAEFPSSHFCHISEYVRSNSPTTVPASGAWIDPSVDINGDLTFASALAYGREPSQYTCSAWTSSSNTSFTSTHLRPDGRVTTSSSSTAPLPPGCGTMRPLACCNGAPKVEFAGFTAATTNGAGFNGSGRPGMHAACHAEFPDSHFCHIAEYLRAASPIAVPTTGAWIDPSANENGDLDFGGGPRFGREGSQYTCAGWTNANQNSGTSTFLDVDGVAHTHSSSTAPLPIGCAAVRPLACCKGG